MTKRSERFVAKYDVSTEKLECIGLREKRKLRVKKYKGLDRYRIFFELKNGDKFLNEVQADGCKRLGANRGISIDRKNMYSRDADVCKDDEIEIQAHNSFTDGPIMSGGTTLSAYEDCKLGYFYELTERN